MYMPHLFLCQTHDRQYPWGLVAINSHHGINSLSFDGEKCACLKNYACKGDWRHIPSRGFKIIMQRSKGTRNKSWECTACETWPFPCLYGWLSTCIVIEWTFFFQCAGLLMSYEALEVSQWHLYLECRKIWIGMPIERNSASVTIIIINIVSILGIILPNNTLASQNLGLFFYNR